MVDNLVYVAMRLVRLLYFISENSALDDDFAVGEELRHNEDMVFVLSATSRAFLYRRRISALPVSLEALRESVSEIDYIFSIN